MTLRLPLDVRPDVAPEGHDRFGSVLIVDDDPAFRAVLRGAIGGAVDEVTEVGDGAEALRALRGQRPDLVLLDLHIPAPDGAAVLEEMRRGVRRARRHPRRRRQPGGALHREQLAAPPRRPRSAESTARRG